MKIVLMVVEECRCKMCNGGAGSAAGVVDVDDDEDDEDDDDFAYCLHTGTRSVMMMHAS